MKQYPQQIRIPVLYTIGFPLNYEYSGASKYLLGLMDHISHKIRSSRRKMRMAERSTKAPAIVSPIFDDRGRVYAATQTITLDLSNAAIDNIIAHAKTYDHEPLITVVTAIETLLYKYSAYTSEVLNIRIGHKTDRITNPIYKSANEIQLLKTITGKETFEALCAETHKDLDELLPPLDYGSSYAAELNWTTDNDGPGQEYQIIISKIEQSCKINFTAPDKGFFCKVFKNAPAHLAVLLNNLLEQAQKPVSEIEYLNDAEKATLNHYNYGVVNANISQPQLLHLMFEQTAKQFGDNTAVEYGEQVLNYRELDKRANKLAKLLIDKGVKPGNIVGIHLKRSPEAYISMLAVLKVGAAYVPLDTTSPEERLVYILTDCKAALLITSPLSGKTLHPLCEVLNFDAVIFAELNDEKNDDVVQSIVTPADAAYVIYTSGTTGRPKGVVIPHSAVCNLVNAEKQLFNVVASDRVLQGFSVAFDASIEEIWLALNSGATLVPAAEEVMYSGQDLAQFIEEKSITVLSTVPTMLSMMQPPLPTLRILILGGEYCSHELLKPWYQKRLRIVNTYGPTEATVIATYADFDPAKKITIGKPVINYSTFILDANLMPVPANVPGELCIGGPGLATTYINQEKLNTEKFVKPPFNINHQQPQRLYRSGDLARFNEDGNIEFLGRIDSQVKLRGYRIELSEIESQLLQIPGVKNAVVAVKVDEHNVQRLVAYLVLKDKESVFDEEACRAELKSKLATYMVPSVFVVLNEFPVLPSGKVDRKQLPVPAKDQLKEKREIVAPSTDTELKLQRLWQRYFSPQEVSATDDFFDLGGHSLLASLIVSEIRKMAGMARISVQDIYTFRTIVRLSAYIDELAIATGKEEHVKKEPVSIKRTSPAMFTLVTFLQGFTFLFFMMLTGTALLTPYIVDRLIPNINIYRLITFSVLGFFMTLPIITFGSIAAKWIFIGRFKEGRYPLWGWYYFRFWLVKRLIDVTPIWLFSGTPFINWYFRLMGAKIGKRVYLGSDRIRIFDLLSIGDNTSISREAHLLGYNVEHGELVIGKITIGRNSFVGTRSVVSAGATMEDGASLGELSLLEAGTVLPSGEHWEGSPAVSKGVNPDMREATPIRDREMPFASYVLSQYLAVTFVLLFPLALMLPFTVAFYYVSMNFGFGWALLSTIFSAAAYTISFCLLVVLIKWVIVGRVKEEDFSIYSSRHVRKWIVDTLMHMSLITFRSIYATIYLPTWLRMLGARIGKQAEISTVNQMSTDLLKIGAGSFLADSVSVGSPEVRKGIMRLRNIRIGDKTFIGNSAVIGSGDKIGNDCLIGVLSTPPEHFDKGMINNSSWLGSPAMYLPRRQESEKFPEKFTFQPTADLFIKRGFIEFFKITLPVAFTSALLAAYYYTIVWLHYGQSLYHLLWLSPLVLTILMLAMPLIAIAFKWVLIGRYKPSNKPLWSVFVWKNELVNSLCEGMAYPLVVNLLLGTPFAPLFFRLMGCQIGKRVYMETSEITEFDLVHIGDNASLNFLSTIQTHLFEDRVMKMSHLYIGDDCSIGPMAVVLYDSVMEDSSSIDALSLVMKGEIIPQNTSWAGSPAKFVSQP